MRIPAIATLVTAAIMGLASPVLAAGADDPNLTTRCPSACVRVAWYHEDGDLYADRVARFNPDDNNRTYNIDTQVYNNATGVLKFSRSNQTLDPGERLVFDPDENIHISGGALGYVIFHVCTVHPGVDDCTTIDFTFGD